MSSVQVRSAILTSLLFAVLFPAGSAFAQGTIAGTVRSAADGSGLPTVEVQVLRPGGSVVASVLTGNGGAYRILNVSPGTYSVTFRAPGWEASTETDVVVAEGETTTVGASLLQRSFTLNPISVTTSKRVEKTLDAPASVQVVDKEDVEERPATSLTDHVKEKAAVDVITTGVQSNYVVIRGFNNIFSGQTLSLTDNRIARVPSLRANISHLQPTTNSDIDRIEVVLGPASALYGPNAANGVVHYLTKSPIDDPGTSLSIAGGLRQQGAESLTVGLPFDANQNGMLDDEVTRTRESSTEEVFHAEGRHAWANADGTFGIKLSGQYFNAMDYDFFDDEEVVQQSLAGACIASGYSLMSGACLNFAGDLALPAGSSDLQTRVDNVFAGRDTNAERWALDLRTDFRPSEDLSVIVSGGRTTAVNSVDLTGIGAGQVRDWNLWYGQARANYRRLFAQVFFNKSDNQESYLLRSGRPLADKSSLFVAQLQHGTSIDDDSDLIYGVDFLHTVPKSEGTINGRHEDDDIVNEIGGYAQYERALSDKVDITVAARVDKHSRLEDPVFSPRAAVVYKPNQENSFRLTFNRAFTTPTTLNLFLDVSAQSIPIPGTPFRYDVRAQGATEDGFEFMRLDGVPMHMSPFNPLLGGSPREFLPTTTSQLWAEAVALVSAADPQAGGLLQSIPEPGAAQVPVVGATLNAETGAFGAPILDLTSIIDPDPLKETTWQTLEAGYKGLLDTKWLVAVNGYWTRANDFVSALQPITPNVFLPEGPTQAYLQSQFRQLVGTQPPFPFGSEAEADAAAAQLAAQIGAVPLGVITPSTAGGITDPPLIVTYRNLGDFDLFGADLGISYLLTNHWELTGTVSWVSDETFDAGDEEVALNAPSFKGSFAARYRNEASGFSAALRARFIDGFPVASGVYLGEVDAYSVFDINVGYRIPGAQGLRAQLDVQNVFDEGFSTFPGTPELGRFTALRLLWTP